MMTDKKNYDFGSGPAQPKPKPAPKNETALSPEEKDEPVGTVTIHKKPEGGYKFKHDQHDGMPADEHESVTDLAKSLEEKYGEDQTEQAEEHVSPGVHEKAGGYLEKALGK